LSLYKIIAGDTFELVARKKYGDESQASRIASANPGTSEPLVVGTQLVIPAQPSAPKDILQQAQADDENEVAVLIECERFRFWENIRTTRSIDAMDTVEFTAPQDPAFRKIFKPFSYKSLDVTVGGDPLFTGTMIDIVPTLGNKRRTLDVSGYSLPGVLNDCTPPASMAGLLEFFDQGLEEIAKSMAAPFGLDVKFDADPGAIFDLVAVEMDVKVLRFLTKLAQQRNLIVTSTPEGALLFHQSVTPGKPVATLAQGASPVVAVVPDFDPQRYHSHITGVDPVLVGLEGGQFTVKNERLPGVVRPFTFKTPDTIESNVKASVDAKAGRMFANVASYTIELSSWRDPSGNLWTPNTTLKLEAPGAMIYNPYEFVIRSVELNKTSNSETARLNLVIPGSFSGKIPETLPWDE